MWWLLLHQNSRMERDVAVCVRACESVGVSVCVCVCERESVCVYTHSNCHQSANMSHIGQEVSADIVTNLPHSAVVQDSRVGTSSSNDDTRVEILGLLS